MNQVLSGGTAVTDEMAEKLDIRISGGCIAAMGRGIGQPGDEILDVSGCYLFPGGIDPHTHFDLAVGGTVTADDFASGTRAALTGGTTTILDYATQSRGGSLAAALTLWRQKAEKVSFTDYGFHMALCDCGRTVLEELPGLAEAGVSSLKLYMAYKNTMQIDDAAMFRVMRTCRRLGQLLCLHCENGDIIDEMVSEAKVAGKNSPAQHAWTRPDIAEAEAVNRALCLSELTGCRLYVVHVSSARALERILTAKGQALPVAAETCPQYLLLDETVYGLPGFEGAKYVMSPPLRTKVNQATLWRELEQGGIDCVGSDHCSFNFAGQKTLGHEDFSRIPNGIPGAENRFGLIYTYGVVSGRINLQRFVSITSTAAAKIFGLYPRKGTLQIGSDADIVVWDPAVRDRISATRQFQRVDYNPYEGLEQVGAARHVFLRGKPVITNGKIAAGPQGIFLPRPVFVSGEDSGCTVLPSMG